jgi:putative hemolysin
MPSKLPAWFCNYLVCSVSDFKTFQDLVSFPMRFTEDIADDAAAGPAPTVAHGTSGANSRFSLPRTTLGQYRLRFAETKKDREAAFRLRFVVFNLELNEGLKSAYKTGYDNDLFDEVCDHLIVEHVRTEQVVGTYRLQTGKTARANVGYYSEREFDFTPYESIRDLLVELGRAAVHRDHRSFDVLTLLWRGVAAYAMTRQARYLIGCSSLTSQCLQEGSDVYARLQDFLADASMRTVPRSQFSFPILPPNATRSVRPPKLLRAYLSIGAKICGPPAIDREFKTIDFLTLMDLQSLPDFARSRFFSSP